MKARNLLNVVAITAMTLLVATLLCGAGVISEMLTFETNLVSDELITKATNGLLRAWSTFPRHDPTNAAPSLRSLYFPWRGDIKQDRDLELRADILQLAGEGAYAALGWSEGGIPAQGYRVLLNAQEVALVNHRFDRQVLSPFFWERLPVTNRPMTLILRFSVSGSNLSLHPQVLDQENPSQVIFEKKTEDGPGSEAVVAAPAPLQAATPDPGPAWRRTGWLLLSLFGANTNSTRLEMDVDNFGVRQTLEVTPEDYAALIYTNASQQTLAFRLFIPTNQQPGTRYPLVLLLHGGGCEGDDNIRQLSEPEGLLDFVSPEIQVRHPCFLVAPQVPTAVHEADPTFQWWHLRERVIGLLNTLQDQYPIDPDRIYITGGSLGGIGTWMLAAEYPDLFAAAAPVAGPAISEHMMLIAHLPIWAFHGAIDPIYPPDGVWPGLDFAGTGIGFTGKGSRGLIANLRRLGACPIYSEYAWVGHGIFGGAYETPGLVDWMMAQRRGKAIQHSPWIAVTTPASNGVWTTSYNTLDLAGTACADAGITNVVWRNENLNRTGPVTGTTNWFVTGVPLRLGRTTETGIIASTNVVTVTATCASGSDLYGGTTTFNAALRVVQVPIRLQTKIEGVQIRLEWTGVAPQFVVQHCTDLRLANWLDVVATGEINLVLL